MIICLYVDEPSGCYVCYAPLRPHSSSTTLSSTTANRECRVRKPVPSQRSSPSLIIEHQHNNNRQAVVPAWFDSSGLQIFSCAMLNLRIRLCRNGFVGSFFIGERFPSFFIGFPFQYGEFQPSRPITGVRMLVWMRDRATLASSRRSFTRGFRSLEICILFQNILHFLFDFLPLSRFLPFV